MNKEYKSVEKEIKEEAIPEKIMEAYDSLMIQVKNFNEEEIKAHNMKTKALGALEVFIQMYPKLQEIKSDS